MAPRKANPTLEKCPTGIRGLDEILQWGAAARAADARLRRGGQRQDAAGDGVHRARGARPAGAGGVHGLRGDARRSWLRMSPRSASICRRLIRAQADGARPRQGRAQRDRGDRRVRPGGALRAPGQHDQPGRGQAGGDRLARGALRGPSQRGDPAGRAAAALPLAEGQGGHGRSSPASRAAIRSPATVSRNTSATA